MEVVEALRAAEARGAHRSGRRGAGRRTVEDRPRDVVGPHPPQQAAALRAARPRPRGGDLVTVRVTTAAPHWLRGEMIASRAPGAAGGGFASRSRWFDPTPRARRPDRVGQVGAGARDRAARGRRRARVARLDAGVPRPRHRDREADAPPSGPRSCTISSTSPIRPRSGRCSARRSRARAAIADIEARGKRAVLVGGTGLYVRAVVDDLQIPPTDPDVRDALDDAAQRRRRPRRARTRGSSSSIRSRPRAWSRATAGASCARSR